MLLRYSTKYIKLYLKTYKSGKIFDFICENSPKNKKSYKQYPILYLVYVNPLLYNIFLTQASN